jgi:hypothetical protein
MKKNGEKGGRVFSSFSPHSPLTPPNLQRRPASCARGLKGTRDTRRARAPARAWGVAMDAWKDDPSITPHRKRILGLMCVRCFFFFGAAHGAARARFSASLWPLRSRDPPLTLLSSPSALSTPPHSHARFRNSHPHTFADRLPDFARRLEAQLLRAADSLVRFSFFASFIDFFFFCSLARRRPRQLPRARPALPPPRRLSVTRHGCLTPSSTPSLTQTNPKNSNAGRVP